MPDAIPQLADREWLRRRYCDDGATMVEIAEELRCTQPAVTKAFKRLGIKARPKGPEPAAGERPCRACERLHRLEADGGAHPFRVDLGAVFIAESFEAAEAAVEAMLDGFHGTAVATWSVSRADSQDEVELAKEGTT